MHFAMQESDRYYTFRQCHRCQLNNEVFAVLAVPSNLISLGPTGRYIRISDQICEKGPNPANIKNRISHIML